MAETVSSTAWSDVPWDGRVGSNGPSLLYDKDNLPDTSDPGWVTWEYQGKAVRLIEVHGPFQLPSHDREDRCEDGWLGIDTEGNPFAVPSEYVTSDTGISYARPIGYRRPK